MSRNLLFLKSQNVLYIDTDSNKKSRCIEILRDLFEKIIFADNHNDAVLFYKEVSPDLIIIIMRTADANETKLIRQLRQYAYHIPIIVISEHNEQKILLEIVNLSIDAYLQMPLNIGLFTDAIHRAKKRNLRKGKLIGLDKNLIFDVATQELSRDGLLITLGVKESQLLFFLIENPFSTLTRDEIEKKLWPFDSVSDSAVKKLILRIRQKTAADLIISVRGHGYRLNAKKLKEFNNSSNQYKFSTFNGDSICQS